MQNDDFYVVATRILSYLYECAKRDLKPSKDDISHEALGINKFYQDFVVRALLEAGFMGNYYRHSGNYMIHAPFDMVEITYKGIEALHTDPLYKAAGDYILENKLEVHPTGDARVE